MKIVYCLNSISYTGGMERITVAKANALADVAGNEVCIIVTDCPGGAAAAAAGLSAKVRVVDLDVNYYADDWKSPLHVLKGICVKRRRHKKLLAAALRDISPDVVISVGQSEKYFLPEIEGRWVKIREFHFRKDFRRLAARNCPGRLAAVLSNLYEYRCKLREYDQTVILTREDLELNWRGFDRGRLSVIPNMLTMEGERVSALSGKKVVAAGRLSWEKNFASLIRAFGAVALRHPDCVLEIYGDGPEREGLQRLAEELRLTDNVRLCGVTSRLQEEMLGASVFVLSSRYEGQPLVMLEAMSCGLPVVSYDCPCGPKDIVTDGTDGFLVPAGDERLLAEKICTLLENPGLRMRMGAAARSKSDNYRPEKIVPMWMELFGRLLAEKRDAC